MPRQNTAQKVAASALLGSKNKYYSKPAPAIETSLKITNVFTRNMESQKRFVLNRGGAGSSKSHSLAQLLTYKFLNEKSKSILILRKSLPYLKISTLPLIYRVWDDMKVRSRFREEKLLLNYYYKDNWMHFGSIDDSEKLKSSEWNYIWVEEATELSLQDFKVLRTRLRAPSVDGFRNQMFLSFNPIDEKHWIKKDVLDKLGPDKVEEIHSTYHDNPFLDQESRAELDDLQNQDKNFWRIMALGEWGRLENIIFNNWDTTYEEMPKDVKVIYGVDFGFNQPSVLVKLGYVENDIWLQELIYEKGLDNSQFIKKIKEKIPAELRYCPIYCDSAEPDRIQEMVNANLKAKLGDKRVKEGIDLMKRFKLHILKDSVNIVKEMGSYVYQTDKNGDPKDIPINWDDHALTAIRYAIYSHLKRGRQYKVRWL